MTKHESTAPKRLRNLPVERELTEEELDERIRNLRNGTDILPPLPLDDPPRITGLGGMLPMSEDPTHHLDRVSGVRWGCLPARSGSRHYDRPPKDSHR